MAQDGAAINNNNNNGFVQVPVPVDPAAAALQLQQQQQAQAQAAAAALAAQVPQQQHQQGQLGAGMNGAQAAPAAGVGNFNAMAGVPAYQFEMLMAQQQQGQQQMMEAIGDMKRVLTARSGNGKVASIVLQGGVNEFAGRMVAVIKFAVESHGPVGRVMELVQEATRDMDKGKELAKVHGDLITKLRLLFTAGQFERVETLLKMGLDMTEVSDGTPGKKRKFNPALKCSHLPCGAIGHVIDECWMKYPHLAPPGWQSRRAAQGGAGGGQAVAPMQWQASAPAGPAMWQGFPGGGYGNAMGAPAGPGWPGPSSAGYGMGGGMGMGGGDGAGVSGMGMGMSGGGGGGYGAQQHQSGMQQQGQPAQRGPPGSKRFIGELGDSLPLWNRFRMLGVRSPGSSCVQLPKSRGAQDGGAPNLSSFEFEVPFRRAEARQTLDLRSAAAEPESLRVGHSVSTAKMSFPISLAGRLTVAESTERANARTVKLLNAHCVEERKMHESRVMAAASTDARNSVARSAALGVTGADKQEMQERGKYASSFGEGAERALGQSVMSRARGVDEQKASVQERSTDATDADIAELAARLEDVDEHVDLAAAATAEMVKAPATLSAVMDDTLRKKLFDWRLLKCTFCSKKGHVFDFCPVRPNEPVSKRRVPFAEGLITSKREEVSDFVGMPLEEVIKMVEARGARLNQGNVWSESKWPADGLRKQLGFWKAIGCERVILSWLAYGVPLRFAATPHAWKFANHRSVYEQMEFVRNEIRQHVKDECFRISKSNESRVCNPLQVEPKGSCGWRMCTDMRYVNAYLAHPEFRLENLQRNLPDVVVKGWYLFTTDLRKAYFSVLMDEDAWQYMSFELEGVLYRSCVMLFGLSIAPMVFHKLMRQIVRFVRAIGIKVLNYLDDFLWSEMKERIKVLIEFVRWLIPRMGFAFSEKSEWIAKEIVSFLGMLVNSIRFEVTVPSEKIARVKVLLAVMRQRAEDGKLISIQDLRMMTGRLLSFSLAIPAVRVWTRDLYALIAKWRGTYVRLPFDAAEEIRFWCENLERLNGAAIMAPEHELIAHTDASEHGWGLTVARKSFGGYLPEAVIGSSSTMRELVALAIGLRAAASDIAGKRLLVKMDSRPATRNLVKGGGPVPELCDVVRVIWKFCEENKTTPTYFWVPRKENKVADELSKLAAGELTLGAELRARIEHEFAPKWLGERVVWVTPKWAQVGGALKLAQDARESVMMVHPIWQSQPWWPLMEKQTIARVELSQQDVLRSISNLKQGIPKWKFAVSYLRFDKC